MGACQSLPNDANCPGSQFCTTEGCTAGTPCAVDSDCDDGNACDGIETCDCAMPPCDFVLNPGLCVPNPPAPALNCNDGVSCTNDACVEDDPAVAGMNAAHCENAPSNALCSNGDPCDGIETCDAVLDCQNGAPLVCDDQVGCTDDLCLPGFGCFHPPDPAPCQDASVCNGQEICNPTPAGPLPTLGCEPGPALACPDVDMAPCTIDFCDEAAGGCTTIVDDGMCGCGLHCDPGAPMVDADGCTDECSQALCDGALWQCGNCIDDDGDCDVDDDDSDCFGVCDDNEAGFAGLIPGQNAANNCKMDCYFDDETGAGGGDCVWSHACDPLDPEPHECTCDAPLPPNNLCDANIPGFGGSCDDAYNMQPAGCDALCGDITPNGCDCFGCCTVTLDDGVTQRNVYLGSETNLPACVGMPPPDPCDGNPNEVPSCNADVIDDPVLCKECTQVPSCLNTCENCELCFGETELPPECGGIPECLGEAAQPCGLPGLADCPAGDFCLTGCCVNF
jgi:hypothetical protein